MHLCVGNHKVFLVSTSKIQIYIWCFDICNRIYWFYTTPERASWMDCMHSGKEADIFKTQEKNSWPFQVREQVSWMWQELHQAITAEETHDDPHRRETLQGAVCSCFLCVTSEVVLAGLDVRQVYFPNWNCVHLFQCTFPGCDRAFNQKYTMLIHLDIHTGRKDYKCEFCNKEFVQKSECPTSSLFCIHSLSHGQK